MLLNLYLRLMNAMRREEGQGLVEYALIIALIAILLITALGFVKGGIQNTFEEIATALGGTVS